MIRHQNKTLFSFLACEQALRFSHSYFLSPQKSLLAGYFFFFIRASVSPELACVDGGIRKRLIFGGGAPILFPYSRAGIQLDFSSIPSRFRRRNKSIRTRIIAPDQ